MTPRALLTLCALCALCALPGCAPSLLGGARRAAAADALARRGEALIAEGERGEPATPTAAHASALALTRAVYDADPALAERLRGALSADDLRGAGVRRGGRPRVGDLLVFRQHPDSLDLAVVLEVRGARLRAVGLLRGAAREVRLDLDAPSTRRIDGEVVNTYLRKARPAEGDEGGAECPCLAGELLVDVRALF